MEATCKQAGQDSKAEHRCSCKMGCLMVIMPSLVVLPDAVVEGGASVLETDQLPASVLGIR